MKTWEEEYIKLNFWDKVRFHFRESQETRLENERQGLENDDRQPIDRLKIAREIRLEREAKRLAKEKAKKEKRAERENRKNKVKALNSGESVQYNEPEDKSQEWKVNIVPEESAMEAIKKQEEKVLDNMVGKELNSKEDAYENIVEIQRFLSHPHDHIPNAVDIVSKKFEAISQILGSDVLEKGMEIAKEDEGLISMSETMSVQDKIRMKMEILKDPKLAETLTYLRYNPEELKKQTGEVVKHQTVYASMVAEMRDKQNREQDKTINISGKSLNEQLMEMQTTQRELGGR